MIEVFKTGINEPGQAEMILSALVNSFPTIKPNFDLDDCDRVLRVDGSEFTSTEIIEFLQSNGHYCELLE